MGPQPLSLSTLWVWKGEGRGAALSLSKREGLAFPPLWLYAYFSGIRFSGNGNIHYAQETIC